MDGRAPEGEPRRRAFARESLWTHLGDDRSRNIHEPVSSSRIDWEEVIDSDVTRDRVETPLEKRGNFSRADSTRLRVESAGLGTRRTLTASGLKFKVGVFGNRRIRSTPPDLLDGMYNLNARDLQTRDRSSASLPRLFSGSTEESLSSGVEK